MNHLDLFSGIGGFALAAQTVWGADYHCVGFCEIDPYCQALLKLRFPGVNVYDDIRTLSAERLIADPESSGQLGSHEVNTAQRGQQTLDELDGRLDLLTGGFPCQPFSQAGKRRGGGRRPLSLACNV